jgi:hypothetical protein
MYGQALVETESNKLKKKSKYLNLSGHIDICVHLSTIYDKIREIRHA